MDVTNAVWNDVVEVIDIGVVGDEIISIVPMIFNHRVVVGPVDDRLGYDHGWCYPNRLAAFAAVAAWDPTVEPEPIGYIKRATAGIRKVPVSVQ